MRSLNRAKSPLAVKQIFLKIATLPFGEDKFTSDMVGALRVFCGDFSALAVCQNYLPEPVEVVVPAPAPAPAPAYEAVYTAPRRSRHDLFNSGGRRWQGESASDSVYDGGFTNFP